MSGQGPHPPQSAPARRPSRRRSELMRVRRGVQRCGHLAIWAALGGLLLVFAPTARAKPHALMSTFRSKLRALQTSTGNGSRPGRDGHVPGPGRRSTPSALHRAVRLHRAYARAVPMGDLVHCDGSSARASIGQSIHMMPRSRHGLPPEAGSRSERGPPPRGGNHAWLPAVHLEVSSSELAIGLTVLKYASLPDLPFTVASFRAWFPTSGRAFVASPTITIQRNGGSLISCPRHSMRFEKPPEIAS